MESHIKFRSRPKLIEIDIRNGFTKISGKLTTSTFSKKIMIPLTKIYLLGLIVKIMLDLKLQIINSHNEILSILSLLKEIEEEEIEEDIESLDIIIKNKITKESIEVFQLKPFESIMIENNEYWFTDDETVIILKGQKYSVFMNIGYSGFQLVSQTSITC